MINQNTVTLIGKIKRNILISLLRTGAAVLIPDINALTVLYKRSKALTGTVKKLAHADGQLLTHIGIRQITLIVGIPLPVRLHNSQILAATLGNHLTLSLVSHGPWILSDFQT